MKLYEQLAARCPCEGIECFVDLRDVIDGEWDRVVFIQMHAIASKVAAALGIAEVELPEFEDRILFLKGDHIQLVDRRIYRPEKPYDRTVFLDFSAINRKFEIVSRDDAIFTLKCSSSGDRRNMMLVARPDGRSP